MKFLNVFKTRSFKHSALTTGVVAVFIVAVIIVNIIATLLLERFPISVDLTSQKIYQVSDQTISYIKTVKEPITITVLCEEGGLETAVGQMVAYMQSTAEMARGYVTQTENMLKKYSQYNDKIKVKYINLAKNPDFAKNYTESLMDGNFIVTNTRTNRYKILPLSAIFRFEQDENQMSMDGTAPYIVTGSNVEQEVTSAIMYVTDENPTKITYVIGHEELAMEQMQAYLSYNNYAMDSINLLTTEISDSTNLIAICAPRKDYSEAEIKKLDKFLDNNGAKGKNLVYYASAQQPKLPKLEGYLKEEWGINIGENYIQETAEGKHMTGDPSMTLQEYSEATYSANVQAKEQRPFLADRSRPLSQAFTERGNTKTEPIIQSSETAAISTGEENDKVQKGTKGIYASAILSTRNSTFQNEQVASKVMVMGSIESFDTNWLAINSFGNAEFAVGMYNVLTDKKDGIIINPMRIETQPLQMTQEQFNAMAVIFVAVVPLLFLAAGLIIWLRRRNR